MFKKSTERTITRIRRNLAGLDCADCHHSNTVTSNRLREETLRKHLDAMSAKQPPKPSAFRAPFNNGPANAPPTANPMAAGFGMGYTPGETPMVATTPSKVPEAPKAASRADDNAVLVQKKASSKGVLRLGELLIQEGRLTEDQLKKALSQSKASKRPLGTTLVRMGILTEEELGKCLATLHHLDYLSLANISIPDEVLTVLPEDFIKQHLVLPICVHKELKRIEVTMARPDKMAVLDEIALITGYRAVPKVSTHTEILEFIDTRFRQAISGDEALKKLQENHANSGNTGISELYAPNVEDLDADVDVDDAPVVMLVNSLLMNAIEQGASDIHVEPQNAQLLIRYRIDGILKEIRSIPKNNAAAIVSRIKVSSGMDIAERRKPQDGRMRVKIGSQEVDMRVSSIPVQFGEKICIRILRGNVMTGGTAQLGLTEYELDTLTRMVKAPNGIVLVTGPTGSGKTTTLYACLREINSPEINISTVEDPIEYPLAGINQTPMNPKAGVTFASTLRALLRQDPDVILVGEIRDEETLEAGIHAALTGHLVFSTLHTNSAAKTVNRLLEMGAPNYMVSSAVVGILAQRLVRTICNGCKTEIAPTAEDRVALEYSPDEPLTLYQGAGCQKCNNTGYSGRTAVYEIMKISREIQELVEKNAPTFEIQDMAVKQGMSTLAMSAKRKILEGKTTVEEVNRILGVDWEG